jgi:hypothetical protein
MKRSPELHQVAEKRRLGLAEDGPHVVLRDVVPLGRFGCAFARLTVSLFVVSLIAAPFVTIRLAWRSARELDPLALALFALVAVTWFFPRHVPVRAPSLSKKKSTLPFCQFIHSPFALTHPVLGGHSGVAVLCVVEVVL